MSIQKKSESVNAECDSASLAVIVAVLLDRDPQMAAEIKQHISPARLLELLKL